MTYEEFITELDVITENEYVTKIETLRAIDRTVLYNVTAAEVDDFSTTICSITLVGKDLQKIYMVVLDFFRNFKRAE